MREYLTTTTLGDLMRKSSEVEITPVTEEATLATETLANVHHTSSTTPAPEANTEVTNDFTSMIRRPWRN